MEKLKNGCKKIGDFFTSLFNLASYTEQQKTVNDNLKNIATELGKVSKGLQENTTAMNNISGRMNTLEGEIAKIKDGLQIELFGSLQALHTRLMDQHYATIDQKREAELYYTQIHNLGKDGWSQRYYDEIIIMPESREEYWKQLSENK